MQRKTDKGFSLVEVVAVMALLLLIVGLSLWGSRGFWSRISLSMN